MKQMGRHYTSIQFKVEGEVPKDLILHANKALHIVLVLQETVNNSVKHADATIITACSSITDKEWSIEITDNGKGFDTKKPPQKKIAMG